MKKQLRKLVSAILAAALILTSLMLPQQTEAKAKTYATRADVLASVTTMLGATRTTTAIKNVKDVRKTDRYYKTMSIALNAGLVTPSRSGKLYPTRKANYAFVSDVLAEVLQTTPDRVLGKRNGSAYLTKAQLKSFLSNRLANVISKSTSKVKKGNVIIQKPGVVLKNTTVNGNLIIGDGVGSKEATLDNVTVTGKLIVRGGGENSIIIKGTSKISKIIVRQANNNVSLKISGDANVSAIYINDGCNDVNIVGSVGSLTVKGSDMNVTLTGADVASVTVADSAKNVTITADKDSTVADMTIRADNTTVNGEGKYGKINVSADNTAINTAIEKENITVTDGAANTTLNGSTDLAQPEKPSTDNTGTGNTTTGGSSSSGGSGSGSGSGSGNNSGSDNNPVVPDEDYYETDDRFAEGYPKISTDAASGTMTVIYKLKDGVASEEHPAEIYNVISSLNTGAPTNTEAVLHGHLGIVSETMHVNYYADNYGYLNIKDSQEHSCIYSIYTPNHLDVYSVIKTTDRTSAKPTKISFDSDSVDSLIHTSAPIISSIYSNNAGNTLYAYVSRKLDNTVIPDTNCFAISEADDNTKSSSETAAVITPSAITIHNNNNDDRYDGTYSDYIEIQLPKEQALDSAKQYTLTYTIPENGVGLQDTANIPNKVSGFSKEIQKVNSTISDVYYSMDDTYIQFNLSGSPRWDQNTSNWNNLVVKIDNTSYTVGKNMTYSWHLNNATITIYNETPNPDVTSHTIAISPKDGTTLQTYAFDNFVGATSTDGARCEDLTITNANATYHKASNTITWSQTADAYNNGSLSLCPGCMLTVKIGNKEYSLRGSNEYVYLSENNTNDGYSLAHLNINPDEITDMQIKYNAPKILNDTAFTADYHSTICNKAGKPAASTDYIPVTIVD